MASHPPLDEPKTPMWLPAVGALLFLAAGIWWVTRPEPPKLDQADLDAAVEAAAADAAPDAGK
jgi:hypothetical protein